MHWRRKWQPTPVFLPGESQGQRSLLAAVCEVAQSRTRLKRLSNSSSREAKSKHIKGSYTMTGSFFKPSSRESPSPSPRHLPGIPWPHLRTARGAAEACGRLVSGPASACRSSSRRRPRGPGPPPPSPRPGRRPCYLWGRAQRWAQRGSVRSQRVQAPPPGITPLEKGKGRLSSASQKPPR